jgi:acyl-coenzyme A synthetase/AMP-(fatty) acid ligase
MSELFNASAYLLDRQIAGGHGARLALTGTAGEVTYGELHDRVRRLAAGLRRVGVQPDHRVMMFMADSPRCPCRSPP